MQENSVKNSLLELRKATGGIYSGLQHGGKMNLVRELMAKFGGDKTAWVKRLSYWSGGPEYSNMNEYMERQVHEFIAINGSY